MELSAERKRLLERLLRNGARALPRPAPDADGAHAVAAAAVSARPVRTEPASFAQRRLWFVEQLQQSEVPYTLHSVAHLAFAVDASCLEAAIAEIVRRHEVLRTTFALSDDEPCQRIAGRLTIPLRIVDLSHLPAAQRQEAALREMGQTVARRFDLSNGPLLRTELYRLTPTESLFLLAVHHIVFDGPSFHSFFAELQAIYAALLEGRPHALPQPRAQYADVAREQRARLTPDRIADLVAFWRAELAGTPTLELPSDRQRSRVPSFRGHLTAFTVAPAQLALLQQRAARERTTLFTVLLAGFWVALARVSGQDDFAVGLPVTGRDSAEREQAIGLFVDTVVVRADLRDDPASGELIARAHRALQRSLAHRSLPFELLVQHLSPPRELGLNPFFQVGFQLMLQAAASGEAGDADLARSSAMFDVGVDLWHQNDGLHGRVQYNSDILDRPSIDLLLAVFRAALDWLSGAECPLSELRIGDAVGRGVALSRLDGDVSASQQQSCVELIEERAAQFPDGIALQGTDHSMLYAELLARSSHLSRAILDSGVAPGSLIALDMRRSIELPLAQLAVWRAGCAFICIDPAWPGPRRQQILSEAQPRIIVDERELARLEAARPRIAECIVPDRATLAYVIYTSGSSGQPKGVQVEHGGLLNVACAQRLLLARTPGNRIAQLASSAFDASVFEILLAFAAGATLVVAPPDTLAGPDLAAFLTSQRVDTIVIPPSLLATLNPSDCPTVRLVCVAGESCPADLAERWADGREFRNLYGPAEASIWTSVGDSIVGSRVSIGRPIPNTSTFVIDRSLRTVPVGIAGELCIGGAGVARGYLDRDSLTTERFVQLPGSPAIRVYRTGDLVRQTRQGQLIFLGRIDRQIKVRGVRIEPDEIETVVRAHPLVRDAVVSARVGSDASTVLVCHVVCDGETNDTLQSCLAFARERLPRHLVPSRFIRVDVWPRTASGKIDLRALPQPDDGAAAEAKYVEPSTSTERLIAQLMAHAAHVPRVGASDDFFRVGGHSLSAALLVSQLRDHLHVDLAISDVFFHSTVSALAARIETLRALQLTEPAYEEEPLVRLPRRHELR